MIPGNLTVYVRTGCHLCDTMVAQLAAGQRDLGYEFHLVDVDRDPALAAHFGLRIPVLAAGEREICHYVLDRAALSRYLQGR